MFQIEQIHKSKTVIHVCVCEHMYSVWVPFREFKGFAFVTRDICLAD